MDEQTKKQLVAAAITASENAYIPYSGYPVGAALLAVDGTVYGGCNIENAAYPATICAERTALVKGVSEGQRDFVAIAIATENGGFPCGVCRQMLFEFSPELRVIIATMDGTIRDERPLSALLAEGFGPSSMDGYSQTE